MKRGFTLIELLVVIVVIGILATLIISNFSSARERARDTKRKNDLREMKTALRLYYNDFQTYPAASGGRIQGCGANGTSNCAWGSAFTAGSSQYMKVLPTDPLNVSPNVYTYAQTNSGEGFTITARLENASDQDSTTSQTRCSVTPVARQFAICED
jgi:general secretion pathway protein G